MSVTVYRFAGITVKIHGDDHNPPHIHAIGKGFEARFEIKTLKLMTNTGFSRADIRRIRTELKKRVISAMEIWNDLNE